MRRHTDGIVFATLLFGVVLLVIGGAVGIAMVTRPLMLSSLFGPVLSFTYRPGTNPWTYAYAQWAAVEAARSYAADKARSPSETPPDFRGRSFKIVAEVMVPRGGAEGTIIAEGGSSGGWAFYFASSKPVFHYNLFGIERYTIVAARPLRPGSHILVLSFTYDGGGVGKGGAITILANGEELAAGRVERTIPAPASFGEGLDIGEDNGTPVGIAYEPPFKFTGETRKLEINFD